MLKKLLSATVFGSSLVLANAIFVAPALAEVVYNRGNAADPEVARPAQDLDRR